MIKENESICVECDKKTNDDTETRWNEFGEPVCASDFKPVKLDVKSFEQTDRELENEPEFQHLTELCHELGIEI